MISILSLCLLLPLVYGNENFDKCLTSKVTYPKEWGAEEPLRITSRLQTPVKVIYIEPTYPRNSVQGACPTHEMCAGAVNRLLNNNFGGEIEFDWNFLIGFAGEIFVAKSFEGALPETLNHDDNERTSGIRIGIIGGKGTSPLPRVWASIRNLIKCGVDNGLIDPNYTIRAKGECEKSFGKRFTDIVTSLRSPGSLKNTFECINGE